MIVAFNRVIAKQLRKDIEKCLKSSPHDGMPIIRTIHALCLDIIGSDTRILLPHEEDAMIYDVLCEHSALSDKYNSRKEAEQALRDHEARYVDDIQLWQAVEQWNVKHRSRLISELPSLLLDKIHGGDYSETYCHVIVDEFQDLTAGEQKLFLQIRETGGSFVALGDPRQSIYSFRGNDKDGLYKVEDLVKPSGGKIKQIEMTECQRCPKEVVHAANQLMSLSKAAPMVPGSSVASNTHVVVWKSLEAEAEGMAKIIIANIRANPNDDHLAMVTRRHFGYKLREAIVAFDPTLTIDLSFSEGLLETWPVREAFILFCLLTDPDNPTWRSWLGYRNSADGTDCKAPKRNASAYLKFFASCKDKIAEVDITNLAKSATKPPGNGGQIIWERAKRYLELKARFHKDISDPVVLIQSIFDADKWNANSCSDPETAKLDMAVVVAKAVAAYEESKEKSPGYSPTQHLQQVAKQLRYQIATREMTDAVENDDLRITTLWGAKGVTADHVYVLGLCGEAIPGKRRDEYHGTDNDFVEEQRRLFYVSITRSKKTLMLSRANSIEHGQAQRLRFEVEKSGKPRALLTMSPFLRDIIKYLPAAKKGEEWVGNEPEG